jgi:hypothetical protein
VALAWDSGIAPSAEVWVSANDERESLFARATRGEQVADWLVAPGTYTFRLYLGESRSALLGVVSVQADQRR